MYRNLTIVVLLASLAIRLAAGFWWQRRLGPEGRFGFPDSESYWALAGAVARGGPYQFGPDRRVFRTPGYPVILAGLFWLAGGEPPIMAARVLNAVLGTAAVAGVMTLARLLFDRKAALAAGAAVALYPGAIATSTFVLSEAPFCPLMVFHLVLWVVAWSAAAPGRQAAWSAAGGAAAGLAALMRPSWLLFVPFALCPAVLSAVWLARRTGQRALGPIRRHMGIGLWMIAGLALVMAPWWVRNWRLTGRFVPTTLQVGESLYDGLNPEATGASDMRFVDRFRAALRREESDRGADLRAGATFEERLDRRMRDAALTWARQHPGKVIRLAGVKFLRMWNVWPNEPSLARPLLRAVVALGYVPLLVFGLCGAWKFSSSGWPYVVCFLPAVYFTCLHVVFVGSIRYRQPAMLPLAVLAAGFVVRWAASRGRGGERRRRPEAG